MRRWEGDYKNITLFVRWRSGFNLSTKEGRGRKRALVDLILKRGENQNRFEAQTQLDQLI